MVPPFQCSRRRFFHRVREGGRSGKIRGETPSFVGIRTLELLCPPPKVLSMCEGPHIPRATLK